MKLIDTIAGGLLDELNCWDFIGEMVVSNGPCRVFQEVRTALEELSSASLGELAAEGKPFGEGSPMAKTVCDYEIFFNRKASGRKQLTSLAAMAVIACMVEIVRDARAVEAEA